MSNENNNNRNEKKKTKTIVIHKSKDSTKNINKDNNNARRNSLLNIRGKFSSLEDLKTTANIEDTNDSNNINVELVNKEILKKGLAKRSLKSRNKKRKKKKNQQPEPVLITEVKKEVIPKKVEPEKKEESLIHKFLRNKLEKLNFSKNLQSGINSGFDKINSDIKENMADNNISIKQKQKNVDDFINKIKKVPEINSGKSGIIFNINKESISQLKYLKKNEKDIKNKLDKIEEKKKLIEEEEPLHDDIVSNNLKNNNLKKINSMKNDLLVKLKYNSSIVSEVIDKNKSINRNLLILNYNNHSNKSQIDSFSKHFSLSEDQEKFNLYLRKRQLEEKIQREKIKNELKKSESKKMKELKLNEDKILQRQKEHLFELKKKEKEIFDKLKEKNNLIMEKSFKNIKNKDKNNMRQTKDYLFFQVKQKFENNEKKLVDKINMMKKEPLVTKKELEELAIKRNERKQILEEGLTERKINLMKMWKQRSQNIPVYKHPIVDILEDEQLDIIENEHEKLEQKEKNEEIKKNYQTPKVKINPQLKQIREKKIFMSIKDSVTETEANNKKRLLKNLDYMNNIIEAAKLENVGKVKHKDKRNIYTDNDNKNKNIRIRLVKSLDSDEKRKKYNYKLHPKPEKPFDYLKEIMNNKKTQTKEKKDQGVGNILTELNDDNKIKGRNQITDAVDMIKSKTKSIDLKVMEKKEYMKVKGGYINNTNIGDEVGNLLIESIQTKLSLLNKLKGK